MHLKINNFISKEKGIRINKFNFYPMERSRFP